MDKSVIDGFGDTTTCAVSKFSSASFAPLAPGVSLVAPRFVGGYLLGEEIATGGMGAVHLGQVIGPAGFSHTVAIKRLHSRFANDPEFVSMFLDEARLTARIHHPNVVQTHDVILQDGELFLVMDHVSGESLGRLILASLSFHGRAIPPQIAASIVGGALRGLNAAHEARDKRGKALGLVHRDVSPQNLMVGADGIARVLDFGVAKSVARLQTTQEGQLKGKLGYMAPEQLEGEEASVRSDIYAAAVVLWETITGSRLFDGDSQVAICARILRGRIDPPSRYALRFGAPTDLETIRLYERLDAITLRGLSKNPRDRFESAREMAVALEKCTGFASTSDVSEWVQVTVRDHLQARSARLSQMEIDASAISRLPPDSADDSITVPLRRPSSVPPARTEEASTTHTLPLPVLTPAETRVNAPHRTMRAAVVAMFVGVFALLGLLYFASTSAPAFAAGCATGAAAFFGRFHIIPSSQK